MKLKLEHRFACSPKTYWKIATQPEIEQEGSRRNNGEIETISDEESDGIRVRRQRFFMNRELPAAMVRVLKTERIGYELETRIDVARHRAEWTITPLVLPDRVQGAGVAVVTPTSNGCLRIIEGDLTIKVPLLGRKMEERLIAEISTSYNTTAEVIREHLEAIDA